LKVRKTTTPIFGIDSDEFDDHNFVIAIDRVCRGNGTANSRASFGVFWGEGAAFNFSGLLPRYFPQTNQVAEVYAAIQALQEAQTRLELREGCVCKVLILTDSSYLVKGISDWIWKWKVNGYRNSRNQPVVNGNLFAQLNELVYVFESQDIPVWLRHVRREFNQAADALRNQFSNCWRRVNL
jgi:ribonuclease HI